ncbi:MOSC domain-containing protein [Roseibium denhamense]|uniref:MOSC domain-containing protein YiiM n=1 Tax=Roseibium denhamense TaxID=76305 RepID=A0ABY1NF71_9HYPH|nr:MOSC domain-containing protein [Roseibium denhamense]MTI04125.1 MOSC domain-containing protein [Roseibium denhamense]SMP08167.1 MOSC domain-containing protein YiiM [Roseibium denhamense]
MTPTSTILGLFTGQPQQRWDGKAPSAIGKSRTEGRLEVGPNGFLLDGQADLAVHGGPEKAIHHYASEHYETWKDTFPDLAGKFLPGGFGENISSQGFVEADLCIGDVFEAGTVRLQISQGRQPCWKLNLHTENPAMAASFQKSARTGWYYRVLDPGFIEAGDTLTLIDRPCPTWNLKEVILARFNPKLDRETALGLSSLSELADPWRAAFTKKADPGFQEDTSRRLPDG